MNNATAKQRVKQIVRRAIGEPYVGKRLKQHDMSRVLDSLCLQPDAILDAGTEDATFVYWLANKYPCAHVTAVDVDTAAIEACLAARPAAYRERVRFDTTAFADLPDNEFDLITAFDVLEHISDDGAAIADLSRSLRPGGVLLVHVPRNRWTTWSGSVYEVPDEEAWRINPGHVRHGYSPEALRQLLSDAGLIVQHVETWLGRWGVLAHTIYAHFESPRPLRLLSIPITDLCAAIDQRSDRRNGNTVFAYAFKRRS